MTRAELRFLGGYEIVTTTGMVLSLPTRKCWGLLAYLAQSAGRSLARDDVATLLWSRSGEEQSRASLRQELATLRKVFSNAGLDPIQASRDKIQFSDTEIDVDTARFWDLSSRSDVESLQTAVDGYQGPFLKGLLVRSEPFEEWVWWERQKHHDAALATLLVLLNHYEAKDDLGRAIETAKRVLVLEPTHESTHLAMMRLYTRTGRRGEALQQFNRCREIMKRELDASPSVETVMLAEQIRKESVPGRMFSGDAAGMAAHGVPGGGHGAFEPGGAAGYPGGVGEPSVGDSGWTPNPSPSPTAGVSDPAAYDGVAERREMTVLSLGLANAAELSGELDPEDLTVALEAFRTCCAAIAREHGGYRFHVVADRLIIGFGYPRAQEHDPERAVLAGVRAVQAVGRLDTVADLVARCGIASGEVIVTAASADRPLEAQIAGNALFAATELEQQADRGAVIIAASTNALVQSAFETRPIGGVVDGGRSALYAQLYSVVGEKLVRSRFDARHFGAHLTRLIGRDRELAQMLEHWKTLSIGAGRYVTILGEPGIGKSRLIHTFCGRIAANGPSLLQLDCSPHHQSSVLYPIVQYLKSVMGFAATDSDDRKVDRLERWLRENKLSTEEVARYLCKILALSCGHRYPRTRLSAQEQKEKILDALVDHVINLCEKEHLLLIVEDVHWIDPTTGEFLGRLLKILPRHRVMMIISRRPGDPPGWLDEGAGTVVALRRLTDAEANSMLADLQLSGLSLDRMARIVERADGVPLYLEELAKPLAEPALGAGSGEPAGRHPAASEQIPHILQASLMARIDRLGLARRVLEIASVFGRRFSFTELSSVASAEPQALHDALKQLQEADLIFRIGRVPEVQYEFKHALVQEFTYRSILKQQRVAHHRRIASVLEQQVRAEIAAQPEVIAYHFTEGGNLSKAIEFLEVAGRQAIGVSAHKEAISHFRRALALVELIPEEDRRSERELRFLLLLGPQLLASHGFASSEVEAIYARARWLSSQTTRIGEPIHVLWGLWSFYTVRANLDIAVELSERFLSLAGNSGDPVAHAAAKYTLGVCFFYSGDFGEAQKNFRQAVDLFTPDQQEDHLVLFGVSLATAALSYLSWLHALTGNAGTALAASRRALNMAKKADHGFSLAFAQVFAANMCLFLRDVEAAERHASAACGIARQQSFAQWAAQAEMQLGRAADRKGDRRGIDRLKKGLEGYLATGAGLARPCAEAWIAESYAASGRLEEALETVNQALSPGRGGRPAYFDPELLRLKGSLLTAKGGRFRSEAERCFNIARETALSHGTLMLYLRASVSLARSRLRSGDEAAARALLEDALSRVASDPETADIVEAQDVFDSLT